MNGEGPVPDEWWISRICEEFGCVPSVALQEFENAPCGLIETIIEFRAYADAKRTVDNAKTKKDIPRTPMTRLVQSIEFGLAHAEIQARDE